MDSMETDAMAGMGNDEPAVGRSPQAPSPIAQADPAEFELLMSTPDTFVVNVHIPDQGNIGGTDVSIPYESIVDDPRLPAELDTPILLYSETARMSAIAGAALVGAGYSDVTELAGGMQAWRSSGRTVETGS
jgi:phage shock protein E